MVIKTLSVSGFRNVDEAHLELSNGVNLLVGENGAGKTTILEAADVLARGRTFRTRYRRPLIRKGSTRLAVQAETTTGEHLRLEKNQTDTDIRINGKRVTLQSELAMRIPVRILHPDSHQLLQEAGRQGRTLLDWGVFHVKPSFRADWLDYARALKQRNLLLRSGAAKTEVRVWDKQLAAKAQSIHEARLAYFQEFDQQVTDGGGAGSRSAPTGVVYFKGWTGETDLLEDVLAEGYRDDSRCGYTRAGAHRATLTVLWDNVRAAEHASRGQQKIALSALLLAQCELLYKQTGKYCLVLVDDLTAEFDTGSLTWFVEALQALEHQVLITAVECPEIMTGQTDSTLFHVKHGRICQ